MERVIVQFRGSVLGLSFGDHSLSRAAQLMVAFRRKGRLRFDELLLDPPLFQRVAFDLVFVGSGSIWLTDERFEGLRKPSSDQQVPSVEETPASRFEVGGGMGDDA
jgi:hypothetical protein